MSALGAKWAWWLTRWYVPAGQDLSRFRAWLPDKALSAGPIDLNQAVSDGFGGLRPVAPIGSLTLAQRQVAIRKRAQKGPRRPLVPNWATEEALAAGPIDLSQSVTDGFGRLRPIAPIGSLTLAQRQIAIRRPRQKGPRRPIVPKKQPTTYADVVFDYEIHAQWAAFFDHVGWPWTYLQSDTEPDFTLQLPHAPVSVIVVRHDPELTALDKELKFLDTAIEAQPWNTEVLVLGHGFSTYSRPYQYLDYSEMDGGLLLGRLRESYPEDFISDLEMDPADRFAWSETRFYLCGVCDRITFCSLVHSWYCRVSGCTLGDGHLRTIPDVERMRLWCDMSWRQSRVPIGSGRKKLGARLSDEYVRWAHSVFGGPYSLTDVRGYLVGQSGLLGAVPEPVLGIPPGAVPEPALGIPLDVPFEEKDIVKGLGAKWGASLKRWYVPADLDVRPFRRWLTRANEERGPVDMWTILCHPDEL